VREWRAMYIACDGLRGTAIGDLYVVEIMICRQVFN
jgi:hypothetical protein